MAPMLPVDLIATQLRSTGWCHLPDFWEPTMVAALRADLDARRRQLTPAGIGRAGEHQLLASVRRDATLWLDGDSSAQCELLATMESLRFALNRELLLGLFDYEAHYAVYPPGGFYRRHVDAFRGGATNRVLSTVHYLTDDWQPGDGGELLLWNEAGQPLARLPPQAGAALFFLSEEFPHEVLPARRERLSIAGWFRVNGSSAQFADPPA